MGNPRVLVVDDEPEMVQMVREMLALLPCEVLEAANGELALELLRRELSQGQLIDAMLLDVMLPGADGFRILEAVKSDPLLEPIPVILITGLDSASAKARGLQRGADDYVIKPFDPQELLARIGVVLRIRRTEQMLRRRNQELAALDELNRLVSSSLELDRVLFSALAGLERLVETEVLAFVLNEEEVGDWVIRAARSPAGNWLEGRVVTIDGGPPGEALRSNRPVLRQSFDDPFWAEAVGLTPLDLLCVPLTSHAEVVGLLVVAGRAGRLNPEHIPFLEQVAATVAIAVENARLYGELAAFAAELERSQNQLIQAEKMAAVGRMAASIAHEINNPLQAIQNSLHLSLHPALDEERRRRYLQMAQQEVERLIQIVRRMLDFYRPASGTMQPLAINQPVENALALASKRLQQAHIQVISRLAADLPPVLGVANQLTQVFLNVIINAVEAMPEGGTLWIGTAYHAEREQVVVAFRDSGPGIPPEVREHLFEPFHTTKPTGTGLGLAISYGIVERHHGTIRVESPPGQGATFIISLPCHQQKGDA